VRCCSLVIFGKRQIYGRTIVRRVITPPRLLPREKSPVLHSSTHRRSAHLHAVQHLRAQRQLPSRKKESLVPTSLRRTKSPRRRLSLPPSLPCCPHEIPLDQRNHALIYLNAATGTSRLGLSVTALIHPIAHTSKIGHTISIPLSPHVACRSSSLALSKTFPRLSHRQHPSKFRRYKTLCARA